MKDYIKQFKGLMALSPLIVFILFYVSLSLCKQDFYAVPISISFLVACLYSVCIIPHERWGKRFEVLTYGAAEPKILLMIWIFILAGMFAYTANSMGAIDAIVALTLNVLSTKLVLGGLFFASCAISLSVGTSVGTIAALTPIATSMASHTTHSIPILVGAVVGGAYFGDNLSFISDTTIAATKTMECELRDKFKQNIWVALPAAIATLCIYLAMGEPSSTDYDFSLQQFILILPYLFVLIGGVMGINVLVLLCLGTLFAGGIGIGLGKMSFFEWIVVLNDGVMGMSELIIATLLAAGLIAVIKHLGGIEYIIQLVTNHIHGKKGAGCCIAFLTTFINFCTANNTITILTIGPLAKEIADKFQIDRRKCASILDTFSCFGQSIIPYGAQLLIASGLAQLNPLDIIPYLYYPFIVGFVAFANILIPYEKKFISFLSLRGIKS